MKNKGNLMKKTLLKLLCLLFCCVDAFSLSQKQIEAIDNCVDKYYKTQNIPGVSVILVNGNDVVYEKKLGYENIKEKIPVSDKTHFELGSTTKAFTGYGILSLVDKGLIDFNSPVTEYLDWFRPTYNGKFYTITIEQLLHHTSGIPNSALFSIPVRKEDDALFKTVEKFKNMQLIYKPGEKYEYSSLNYDILGLIIETVTNKSYEEYIEFEVLQPLGLNNTYIGVIDNQDKKNDNSKGYKTCFLSNREYKSPIFRGNYPAGYIVSTTEDVARWLSIQLNPELYNVDNIVNKSHIPDKTVEPSYDGSIYAAGWCMYQYGENTLLSHSGENPNFSSFFELNKTKNIGIAVLMNRKSSASVALGVEISNIIMDENDVKQGCFNDIYILVDKICSIGFIVLLLLFGLLMYNIIKLINKKKNDISENNCSIKKIIIVSIIDLVILSVFFIVLYKVPGFIYRGINWNSVTIWAPISITLFIITLYIVLVMCVINITLKVLFKEKK